MKILILTFGSHGDVQPYVALGQGLKNAGYNVALCTSGYFESFIRSHGLDYHHMTDRLIELMQSDDIRGMMEKSGGPALHAKAILKLFRESDSINREIMQDAWNAARAAKPDLLLYESKNLGAIHIAEKLGIPAVMTIMHPMLVPTTEWPAIGFPLLKLREWYNKLSYSFVQWGYRRYTSRINQFRRQELGLRECPDHSWILRTADGRPIPIFHTFSQHLLPRPHDWPDHAFITGPWYLPQQADWTPPAELEAFLAAGPPPVYVGFGSVVGRHPRHTTDIVIKALQLAGQRGIIATCWGGLEADRPLPDTIFRVETAPHAWLFPRMAAVVHHGGVGTTNAGIRAACPTVICPFFGDQPFWGHLIHRRGLGPRPVSQKKLTPARLARAIREATINPEIRKKTALFGKKMQQEKGGERAIQLIDQILNSKGITR